MEIISNYQWSEKNKDLNEQLNKEKTVCQECDGDGVVQAECSHCGSLYDEECEECSGTGFVDGKSLDEAYYQQKDTDLQRLEKWYTAQGIKAPKLRQ